MITVPREFNPIKKGDDTIQIESPSELCIYSLFKPDHEVTKTTINFFNTIAKLTLVDGVKVHIDFSKLERLTAAASVMIFAEISRAQLITECSDVVSFTLPSSEESSKLFRTCGLYKAIMPGTHRKIIKLFEDDHAYQSGVDPNKFLISTLLHLHREGLELTKPEVRVISKGIQEAMLNVQHHAYINEQNPQSGIGKRWWHYVHCDTEKKRVNFIIYDKGASIPKTIQNVMLGRHPDSEAIEHAFKKGITRLTGTTRGKGSQDIKEAAKIKDKSSLLVMSGKGILFIDNDKEDKIKDNLPCEVNGTLIEWSIPYE
ncbi:hypothetical protein [Shewanella sp.]|uniref:hypothetical protein n=1 Tax=Shewanella sp. TaxID=50422 RepID=UPI003566D5A8